MRFEFTKEWLAAFRQANRRTLFRQRGADSLARVAQIQYAVRKWVPHLTQLRSNSNDITLNSAGALNSGTC